MANEKWEMRNGKFEILNLYGLPIVRAKRDKHTAKQIVRAKRDKKFEIIMITSSKRVMHMAHALFNHFQDLEAVSVSGKHSWGDALTEAWRILRVRQALGKGVYYLTYFKGIEIQCRRGTLCPDYIPLSAAPKGNRDQEFSGSPTSASVAHSEGRAPGSPTSANGVHSEGRAETPVASMSAKRSVSATRLSNATWGVINYYDLDRQGWRSFKIAALQRVKRITVDIRYETCHVDTEPIYD